MSPNVCIAISEVLRSKAEQNLSGGFREAVAGYSVLYDVYFFFSFRLKRKIAFP